MTRRNRTLPRTFSARDPRVVARALLGKLLVHDDAGVRRAVRIVETEAYLGPKDRASHARFGPTPRARVMFGPPGIAYVYLVYGLHHCMNVVTGREGEASAVLIRAGEPVEGCLGDPRGPGKLAAALGIRRELHNGVDLCSGALRLEASEPSSPSARTTSGTGPRGTGPPASGTAPAAPGSAPRHPERIATSARVGVGYAGPWARRRLRWFLAGNPWVSRGPMK